MNESNFSNQSLTLNGKTRALLVPTSILQNSLLSPTSEGLTCFTEQQFSSKLQTYLINYVISVAGQYSVYV